MELPRDNCHERRTTEVLEGTFVRPIISERPTIKILERMLDRSASYVTPTKFQTRRLVLRKNLTNPFHLVFERQDEKGRVNPFHLVYEKQD